MKLLRSISVKLTTMVVLILLLSAAGSFFLVTAAGPAVSPLFSLERQEGILATIVAVLVVSAILDAIFIPAATRMVTRPVEKMSRMTEEIARGRFDVTVDHQSTDELGVLAANLNTMASELQAMEGMRKEFISSVSHEFKTPLASIQGFAEVMRDQTLSPEEYHEYAGIIVQESKRLHNLAVNMLRLSKLEHESIPVAARTFSLDEQLRKTLLLLEEEWSSKSLTLDLSLEEVQYTGDEELLAHVWMNVLCNAIRFSPEGGTLTVTLMRGEGVQVMVRDEGPGVTPDVQARIFEAFYQADPSRLDAGNGLGLAIVKSIVDRLEGRLWVESDTGKGTDFFVELPEGAHDSSRHDDFQPEKRP